MLREEDEVPGRLPPPDLRCTVSSLSSRHISWYTRERRLDLVQVDDLHIQTDRGRRGRGCDAGKIGVQAAIGLVHDLHPITLENEKPEAITFGNLGDFPKTQPIDPESEHRLYRLSKEYGC